jgi:hypothetical protein
LLPLSIVRFIISGSYSSWFNGVPADRACFWTVVPVVVRSIQYHREVARPLQCGH